jgi:hypothetical protein
VTDQLESELLRAKCELETLRYFLRSSEENAKRLEAALYLKQQQ